MNSTLGGDAYELEYTDAGECISNLETITHVKGGCSCYIHKGVNGSRFAADGYMMLNAAKSPAKRRQMNNIIDWLSDSSMPIRIEKSIKVIPVITVAENGDMNIMLTNTSFDRSGSFECIVRSDKTFYIINQYGKLESISQKISNGVSVIEIENLEAWNYILLTSKETNY